MDIINLPQLISQGQIFLSHATEQKVQRLGWTFLLYNLYIIEGVSHAETELGLSTPGV